MLQDGYGRTLTYLRVSLLKGCNLSCRYCMPERIPFRMDEVLSADELLRLVGRFVERGISRIRLTGGEPTLRPDLAEIAERMCALPGVEDVALSTNAVRLAQLAAPLYAAGIRRMNVSIDSLRPEVFHKLTSSNSLHKVLDGIAAAREAGFSPIKLNAVMMRGINDSEAGDLVEYAQSNGLILRFIEMMPTGATHGIQADHFVSNEKIFESLGGEERWLGAGFAENSGPARYYQDRLHPEAPGIGFINPLSGNFCDSCNRLRLTADGKLRTCLFGMHEIDLRQHLSGEGWQQRLDSTLDGAIRDKPYSHRLEEGNYGTMQSLVQIGG
jgi:cyclic pyranopterin phosphate synthase